MDNQLEAEFKRYMSHAYMIGAIDATGMRAGEQSFEQWYIEIQKPDFLLNSQQKVQECDATKPPPDLKSGNKTLSDLKNWIIEQRNEAHVNCLEGMKQAYNNVLAHMETLEPGNKTLK